jgi:hypothetical protein
LLNYDDWRIAGNVVCLLAAAAVTNDRILFTNRASA